MARLEDASQCAARTVGLSDDVIAVLRVCAVCRPLDTQVSDAIHTADSGRINMIFVVRLVWPTVQYRAFVYREWCAVLIGPACDCANFVLHVGPRIDVDVGYEFEVICIAL